MIMDTTLNLEDMSSIIKIENNNNHKSSGKTTRSRLRNVGGYLLNKLTNKHKISSKNSSLIAISVHQKKRKNFFSIFDRGEYKNNSINTGNINDRTTPTTIIIPSDPVEEIVEINLNEDDLKIPSMEETNTKIVSLDNSMAKSKISAAASKRKLHNPRTPAIRSDCKLDSINEQLKFDSIDNSNKTASISDIHNSYKSNNSLNKLIEKAKQNLRNIKLSDSLESSSLPLPINLKVKSNENKNTIENFVKISNEFNLLNQEKTLSTSELKRANKKSTSCNSSSELITDNNQYSYSSYTDSNPIHIYDNNNSLACHTLNNGNGNYDNSSTLSDISTNADSPLLINRSKKIKIVNRIPSSNKSIDNQELNDLNGVVEYLKSKFNNNNTDQSSKSFEAGLDKIHASPDDEEIVNKFNEQKINNKTNRKTLTYSRSLKLDQNSTNEQMDKKNNELSLLSKPGSRVAMIINDLKSSTNEPTSPLAKLDSPPTEGKVKLIIKYLEK